MHPGIRIHKLLMKKGITQRRMAADLNINPNTVNGYIRQRRLPDCATLLRIAEYLGTSVDYLLGNTVVSAYPELAVSEEEGSLLSNYRALDEERRRILLEMSAFLHTCSRVFPLQEE